MRGAFGTVTRLTTLLQVVQRHGASGAVEIGGIGVGLDLSPYYERAQAIDLASDLPNQVFGELLELVVGRRRR